MLLRSYEDPIEIVGPAYLAVSTRDFERTARFYAKLFGLRIVDYRRTDGLRRVSLSARGEVLIVVHEVRDDAAAAGRLPRQTLEVEDLDRARESLWNHGVVPTGGALPSARLVCERRPFLTIEDPDGRELELVDVHHAPRAGTLVGATRSLVHGTNR